MLVGCNLFNFTPTKENEIEHNVISKNNVNNKDSISNFSKILGEKGENFRQEKTKPSIINEDKNKNSSRGYHINNLTLNKEEPLNDYPINNLLFNILNILNNVNTEEIEENLMANSDYTKLIGVILEACQDKVNGSAYLDSISFNTIDINSKVNESLKDFIKQLNVLMSPNQNAIHDDFITKNFIEDLINSSSLDKEDIIDLLKDFASDFDVNRTSFRLEDSLSHNPQFIQLIEEIAEEKMDYVKHSFEELREDDLKDKKQLIKVEDNEIYDSQLKKLTDLPNMERNLNNPDNSSDFTNYIGNVVLNATSKPDVNSSKFDMIYYNKYDSNDIFTQIYNNMKIIIKEGSSEMHVKLKPENLGNVHLELIVEKGSVIARFDVENQVVKQALESNLEQLKTALNEKGFQISQFDVTVNKDSKKEFYQQKHRKNKINNISYQEDEIKGTYIANNINPYSRISTLNILA